jgi:mercuric ion transport protein
MRRLSAVGTSLTSVGAAVTAAAASLCCVGPVVVSIVGVGGAVAAAGLKPYRPVLLLGSMLLLGASLWLAYHPATEATEAGVGVACPTRAGRAARAMVWVAAVLWVIAALLPTIIGSVT